MSLSFLLPGAPEVIPLNLSHSVLAWPIALDATHPAQIRESLASVRPLPDYLLGGPNTPALFWLLASRQYPSAQSLWFDPNLGWWNLRTEQPWDANQTLAESASFSSKASVKFSQANLNTYPDHKLLEQIFLQGAWGASQKSDYQRRQDELKAEVDRRVQRNPQLLEKLACAQQEGDEAYQLELKLKQRLKREGMTPEVSAWLESLTAEHQPRVVKHLNICVSDWEKRQKDLQNRYKGNVRTYTSSLPQIQLIDGQHPNSLRHLAPSADWRILLDETGECFDEHSQALNPTDAKLGRLVAVALPQGVSLPPLNNFHASERTLAEVDRALQQLLESGVGIFGFSVQDPETLASNWMAHMHHLVRWVLLQLPLKAGQSPKVEVLIEQRGSYTKTTDLSVLTAILESEFQALDNRFAKLQLSMRFMDKTSPLNGYVDTVAFTWGSPSAESKDRLKRSLLLGHCLLRPSDEGLERLYWALTQRKQLLASDWYALCAVATEQEPILAGFLEQLGAKVSEQPHCWHSYLEEVRQRQRLKQFKLSEISAALRWLEHYAPKGMVLPPTLRLMLESAQLAAENHQGSINLERIQHCLALSNQIHDEAAPEACEALLRLATATTNNFEFDVLFSSLEKWAKEPVSVPGLLNHAKLHSCIGQLQAFKGKGAEADQAFNTALKAFDRLTDPQQVQRERAQTRNYQLIARMDNSEWSAAEFLTELEQHLGELLHKESAEAISRSLAHSGQDWRYTHHLWLRALVYQPSTMKPARLAYLNLAQQWQTGQDHPWGLIEAYRGWLWLMEGQNTQAAQHMQQAISLCAAPQNGPILHWMAEVLRTLAFMLKLPTNEQPTEEMRQMLKKRLIAAPHAVLEEFLHQTPSHAQGLRLLQSCLPFNFH